MTENRITPLPQRKPSPSSLLDRARSGRQTALADRMVTIIQASGEDGTVAEYRFPSMPRIVDLIARLGANAQVLSVRTERLDQSAGQRPA